MLHQYSLQFGFREPYQLLLDDSFSLALTRYKISDPLNQFSNVLQSKKIKPLITQCCMQALYALGKEHQATVNMAKEWERRMCNHREAISPLECIKQCVGKENKHRYIVASENGELRRDLRLAVPGVPMMHFTQAVMVLEPMSPLTKAKIEEKEETKLSLPASEAGLLKNQPKVDVDIIGGEAEKTEGEADAGEKDGDGEAKEADASGRRRKRKAPNPLSARKPKNPRLSMEDKLKREQEIKKQKQRAAARARMEAGKLPNREAPADQSEGAIKRKRRRGGPSKDASSANAEAKPQTEATKDQVASESKPEGSSKTRRKRTKKSTQNGSSVPASAPAAPLESSA